MRSIIKRCLLNLLRSCEKYNVNFQEILSELVLEKREELIDKSWNKK